MDSFKKTFRTTFSPGFLLVLGILLVSVLGMRALTGAWEWALTKKPLEMRRTYSEMPERIGPLEHIASQRMTPVMERRLSTDKYISAVYRDHSVPMGEPGSGFSLHSVYYTGNDEPVSAAHVPEVCYVGGGYERVGLEVVDLQLDIPGAETREDGQVLVPTENASQVLLPGLTVPVRQFEFIPPGGNESGSVLYFFVYNGRYVSSRNRIGLQFMDRSSRYVYYSKIEVTPGRLVEPDEGSTPVFVSEVSDPQFARELASGFLSRILPELAACFPDWEAVLAGDIPETSGPEE